jgi:hypothetical protein
VEKKILRNVCGRAIEQGVCILKTNQELRGLFETPDLLKDIKMKRLGYLGHVIRLD